MITNLQKSIEKFEADKEKIGLIEMRQNESKSYVSFCLFFLFDRMNERE